MVEGEEEMDDEKQEDLMGFLEDLEEDKSYRQNVNIYLSMLITYHVIILYCLVCRA